MSSTAETVESRNENIRTIVACRYPLLREGIAKILEEDGSLSIVSKVSNLIDLIEACEKSDFDILLLDLDLKGLNLNKVLGLFKKKKSAKIILIVDSDHSENVLVNSIRSGVRGYLQKDAESSHLIKSVKVVHNGELWVERKIMGKVLDGVSYPSTSEKSKGDIYDLTETEITIVELVLEGNTNK